MCFCCAYFIAQNAEEANLIAASRLKEIEQLREQCVALTDDNTRLLLDFGTALLSTANVVVGGF